MEKQKKGVRLEHISKIYNDPKTGKEFYAVQDTTLDIEPGTFVTLLGPSGCGKTTFLKTLNGLLEQERGVNVSGRIMLEEADIHGRVEKKCGTGVSDTGTVSVFYL